MEVKIVSGQKAIEAAILRVHTKGQAFQLAAHTAACSVLAHVGKHGDVRVVQTLVQAMIQAMPASSRINSLKLWFETFGPIKFSEDGKDVTYVREGKTRLGDAMAKPFWSFKAMEGTAYTPVDPIAEIAKLMEKFSKDWAKTGTNHGDTIAKLRDLKRTLEVSASVQ